MTPDNRNQSRPGTWYPGLFFLAATRPHLLLPAWLAAVTGGAFLAGSQPDSPLAHTQQAWGLAGWSLALLAANLVNLLADQRSDFLNAKNQAWHRVLGPGHLAAGSAVLTVLGLALTARAAPALLLPVVASLGLGIAYSMRPPRLSGRPGWDLAAHVAGYGIIAPWVGANLAAGSVVGSEVGVPWPAVLYLAPIVAVTFLLTAWLDLGGDRAAGKTTTAVLLAGRIPKLEAWSRHRPTRVVIILLVFLGVLLAGLPGLIAWPAAAVPMAVWLGLSYALPTLTSRLK